MCSEVHDNDGGGSAFKMKGILGVPVLLNIEN
jgi:hypothetical protein